MPPILVLSFPSVLAAGGDGVLSEVHRAGAVRVQQKRHAEAHRHRLLTQASVHHTRGQNPGQEEAVQEEEKKEAPEE